MCKLFWVRTAMMYELWGAKCRPGQIALLRGGQPLAVLDLVLTAIQTPSVLIADQSFIETLATVEGLSSKQRLDLRVSRGLAADFSAISEDHSEQPVIVTASALTSDLAVSGSLMGSQLAIIGGYALPQSIVDSFVVQRLVETLSKCAQHQAAPVIVHDNLNLIDLQLVAGAVRIEISDSGPIKANGNIKNAKPDVEPTRDQVRGHAQFLTATALPVLLAMHMFMRGPGADIIVKHWRTKLQELGASNPNEAVLVTQASARLTELALDQPDGTGKPHPMTNARATPAKIVPANQVKAMLASTGAIALTSENAIEIDPPNTSAVQQGEASLSNQPSHGSGAAEVPTLGRERKPDMSLIYGKPGQPRTRKILTDNELDTFGSTNKPSSPNVSHDPARPVSDAGHKAAIAKIVRDVEAAAAIVSQDAIAQAVRKAEASAAIEREQAVAMAVHNALVAAEQTNAVKLAAAIEEAQAKADAAIASAIDNAKREAQAKSADESRAEIAAAVDKAMAAAEVEKNATVREAQAAGERATKIAVANAIQSAEAAADFAQARAVESAIARTTALADRARDQAVAEALAKASMEAEQLRIAAVQYAVAEARAAAEIEQAVAVQNEVALTKIVLEEEYNAAIVTALAQAATAAEISLRDAVATALCAAQAAAEVAKATAIAQAVAITEGLAERERELAVADALSRADVESKRAMFDAIAKAVEAAHAEAELAQSKAVEQAVAHVTSAAALAQEAAIAHALNEAERAAQERAKTQALAITDLKSRADAEFAAALARKRQRISKLSLAEIEAEMNIADEAWRGKEMTARCCSLLRAMRQTSPDCVGQAPFIETESSRQKAAYDAKLRSALAQTEMRVSGHGGLVTLIFTVTAVGQTDDVRIVKTSGNGQLDAAAVAALRRAVFPAPPVEVGGDIAYTALLHFA
jgi:TonB family protein